MSKKTRPTKRSNRLVRMARAVHVCVRTYWRRNVLHKIFCVVLAVVLIVSSGFYAMAQYYIYRHHKEPLVIGATFIADYARYFDLDPQETMQAMVTDLGIHRFRLVSYWDKSEPVEGTYDFSDLDWEFALAEKTGSKVSLSLGLRQPRWPECHGPAWAMSQPMSVWEPKLKTFMGAVINRYKNSPALQEYQLENEFFLTVFGMCPDFTRSRLVDEFNYVKSQDTSHPFIITRSNNWIGIPTGDPRPDKFGISVYKRVWDKTITKRYFEYPLPAWFYAGLAGGGELLTGKNLFIHELQTEAWVPDSYNGIKNAPLSEGYKSLSPARLHNRIRYGVATGMKNIDLWGVEWWYYAKVKQGDPGLWNAAREELKDNKVAK